MSDLGTTFRYTNRQSDLAKRPEWKAGDPWGEHYTQAGFDDRDSELEVYLATSVTTRQLVLVDANGTVVATFGGGPISRSVQLTFKHNDPLTTDSFIYWTQAGAFVAGSEQLVIGGPEAFPLGAGVSPALVLSRTDPALDKLAQIQGVNRVNLLTQDAAGAATEFFILDGVAHTGDLRATTLFLSSDDEPVFDMAGNFRGQRYGDTFAEGFLGGNTNIANTGTTLITLSAINFPLAGYISFDATIEAQLLVVGNQMTMTVLLDGVGVRGGQWNAVAGTVNDIITTTVHRDIAVTAGSHQLVLTAASAATNNAFQAIAAFTGISATYHR